MTGIGVPVHAPLCHQIPSRQALALFECVVAAQNDTQRAPYNRGVSRRLQRLNHLFQEELSDLIRTELSDPRVGEIVSITRVAVSPDLENASAYVSVMGDTAAKAGTIEALSHAAPFLRRHLLERLRIRRIPHLHFLLDETIEEAARVLELMRQVAEEKERG